MKKIIILLSCTLLSLLYLCGCSLEEFDQRLKTGYKDTTRPKVSCSITKQYKDSYTYIIEGTCTNDSEKDYSIVQVDFICYDKEGYNLGTTWDITSNLLSGQSWKFKAIEYSNVDIIEHCDYYDVSGY